MSIIYCSLQFTILVLGKQQPLILCKIYLQYLSDHTTALYFESSKTFHSSLADLHCPVLLYLVNCHHFPIYLPRLSANLLASVSVMSLVSHSKPSLCIRCRGSLRISASENSLPDTVCTILPEANM